MIRFRIFYVYKKIVVLIFDFSHDFHCVMNLFNCMRFHQFGLTQLN